MDISKDIKDIQYNQKKEKRPSDGNSMIQKVIGFVRENIRYFAAGVIFLLMIIVLAFFMDKDTEQEAGLYSAVETELFEVNAYPEVMTLIEQYYQSYATGDFAALQTLAAPFSDHELGYMEVLSRYVESYQNLIFYTKHGLDASSYMVNVYLEIKFEGVDTLAPGLDFFYVRTNEDGTLYIDNSYSEYNMKNNDNPLDMNIYNLIKEHEQTEELVALLSETTAEFQTAIASDESLNVVVNETIPAAISGWMAELVSDSPISETEGTEIGNTDLPAAETEILETEVPEQEPEPQPQPEQETLSFPEGTVITIEGATNVRKEMSTDSAIVETIYKGTKVTVVMSYAEGWTKVKWDNKTGYIRSDLLQ